MPSTLSLSKEVITAMRGAGLVAEPVNLHLLAQRKEFSSKVPSLLVSAACQQNDSDVNTVGLYNVWDVISV